MSNFGKLLFCSRGNLLMLHQWCSSCHHHLECVYFFRTKSLVLIKTFQNAKHDLEALFFDYGWICVTIRKSRCKIYFFKFFCICWSDKTWSIYIINSMPWVCGLELIVLCPVVHHSHSSQKTWVRRSILGI